MPRKRSFFKDNDAIVNDRARTSANPAFNRPGLPGLLDAAIASQTSSHSVNAVLVRVREGYLPEQVADPIRRWKHLEAYDRAGMEDILVAKLIATSAKQIGMFLVILAIVSAGWMWSRRSMTSTRSPASASSLMAGANAAKSGPGVLLPRTTRSSRLGVPQISPTFFKICVSSSRS